MAGPLETENVSYKSGEETVTGFLVRPDSPGRHPGVIVIHEWWGLGDWVREIDVKIYDGAGHAFENPNNKTGYRQEAAVDAWARMLGFCDKTLK